MQIEPMPPYFLIKIGKAAQQEKKEKIGSLYFPVQFAYLTRELQFGEIVAIGSEAQEFMPMAKIGDYLLVHHFVSGKKNERGYNFYLAGEDKDFNYYTVNAFEIPGERSLAYAVAVGEDIIPTPDYIFLEVPKEEPLEDINRMQVDGNGGIIMPKERKKTRQELIDQMQKNKKRCEDLGAIIPQSPMEEIMLLQDPERKERWEYSVAEIKKLEAENSRISKELNKKKYEEYVVSAVNPEWSEATEKLYGNPVNPGDSVFMLNIACQYIIDFSGTQYIVAETKYFGCPASWIKKAVHDFELHRNAPTKKKARTRN